jgi:hypothetical protein
MPAVVALSLLASFLNLAPVPKGPNLGNLLSLSALYGWLNPTVMYIWFLRIPQMFLE